MTEVFARACADATPLGRLALFLSAAADTVRNAFAGHLAILIRDLRYTARTLNRARGFALTAILVIALGVGANTAAFSVADDPSTCSPDYRSAVSAAPGSSSPVGIASHASVPARRAPATTG